MIRFAAALALGPVLALAAAPAASAREASNAPLPAPTRAKAVAPELAAAVADPLRDADRARDRWRNPAATLAFFGVTPAMKVGEYAPGGGWYSRLLGIYLGTEGRFAGIFFNPSAGPFNDKAQEGIRAGAAKFPADVAGWSGKPADRFSALTLDAIPEAEKGTFDRILIMRMMHNLMRWNIADSEIKALRSLLKDGGMIGIEQHRAKPNAPFSYADGSKGYLREADVIRFMEVNGFELVGRSQANANPADPADWPDGVWTLAPSLRGVAEADKARLTAIGETDRMTLLFRKRP